MPAESFRIVIPARHESSRLPGKVLLDINGKPMLQHVWERCTSSGAGEVLVATDSQAVAESAAAFGAEVCMTSAMCASGTERVAEVCAERGWEPRDIVVNVQGDAPLIPPGSINRVAHLLATATDAAMSTLCTPLQSIEEYRDPNVVKVVFDREGRALYFSRAAVPAAGHGSEPPVALAHRHLGLYAYRVSALHWLQGADRSPLETAERLEQLRALWHGLEIRIAVDPEAHGPDVDTAADLARVAALLQAESA